MQSLVRAALDLRNFKFSLDDDIVDRLNRQITSALLILFAVLVSARQFFGESMHCWCPEVRQSISAFDVILAVLCSFVSYVA